MLLSGCALTPGESLSWSDHSSLRSNKDPAILRALANDSNLGHTERALAIFKLFANYIRPGQSAEQIHSALADTAWLDEAKLYRSGYGSGSRPIEGDSLFELVLFPDDQGSSDWVIEFSLSGRGPDKAPRREQEALAFLGGDPNLANNPKLQEFGLTFLERSDRGWLRTEHFTQRGIHVYGQ